MYRVYQLTDKEKDRITRMRWDGDTYYYDVFDNQEECDAEEQRLAKIEEDYKRKQEEYMEYLKKMEMDKHTEITREEAKELYCKGDDVYICNDKREYWKLPASYEYSSHAPIEELFNRSVPIGEGETRFYK